MNMPEKNSMTSTTSKQNSLPDLIYRSRFIIALLLSLLLLLMSCSKSQIEAKLINDAQQYFEANVLNRNFRVELATDNGADLTPQYNGYLFVLKKNTSYDGPLTATSGSNIYTGTWSSNEDYSKLVISLPATPAEFVFLNREWKFTKKTLPIMELAPWGSTEPKVLHMERL